MLMPQFALCNNGLLNLKGVCKTSPTTPLSCFAWELNRSTCLPVLFFHSEFMAQDIGDFDGA